MKKKYYKTLKEARKAHEKINDKEINIFKMPKGTRHAGQYAVCDYMEYLNTY